MYFLTLEDITDNIEVIVFPTVLEKYKEVLEEDKIVKIKGRLDKKEDQIKLIAIDIEDIKKGKLKKVNTVISEENEKDRVILAVNKVDLSKELINGLYEVIKDFPGSIGVELKILNGNGSLAERVFNFPDNYKVTPDSLFFEKLKEVFKNKLSWELKDSIK
jgi:DNA polymerase III alpha subunit